MVLPWSLQDLLAAVTPRQRPSLLLISGYRLPSKASISRATSSTSLHDSSYVLFGVYLPTFWAANPDSHSDDEESLLFQLAPVHDVFHATVNGRKYTQLLAKGVMHFGNEESVRLEFDERSRKGAFQCGPAAKGTGKEGQGLGSGEERREVFEVQDIEVWVFNE